jgi:hypothetical protein
MTKVGIDNEVVELKGAEEAALLALKAEDKAFFDEHDANVAAKESAKTALYSKLGITAEEAKLLLA